MTQARSEERALLFEAARTHSAWLDRPVDDGVLKEAYELARMGPTSGNSQPLRLLFVKSAEAKEKLLPTLMPGNVDKVRTAPVTAIVAYDTRYYELMPRLSPQRPELREVIGGMPAEMRNRMAEHSALLAAGYFILAARAVGLDTGPLGGFDAAKVNDAFFADGQYRALLLINLGYGDPEKLHPRNPRLSFDEATRSV
jgi:3-hydroxypropanoate dehydrogenase